MPESISTRGVFMLPSESTTPRLAMARRFSPPCRYSTPTARPFSNSTFSTRASSSMRRFRRAPGSFR